MSREYLLKIFFEKSYPKVRLEKFFTEWCGKSQIYQVGSSSVVCEMGCSGGVPPEDTMMELYNQLNAKGFKVDKENIIAWSLHPDKSIKVE